MLIHFHNIKQSKYLLYSLCITVLILCREICILPWQSWQFCCLISNSYNSFHKFGAYEKCVSRLHSMETWESGQPVTRAMKWAKHRVKLISDGRFASSEFCINIKPLRCVLLLPAADLLESCWQDLDYTHRIFFEVSARFSLFKRMPFMAGLCWYDCLEAITMEITTTMEASSGVCQTTVTTRQQLIKLPDTKTLTNGECAADVGGNECEMSHFSLHFCYFCFPFAAKQWVILRSSPWCWLTDCLRSSFTNCFISRDTNLNMAYRVYQIFFILEIHHRYGWAITQYYHL